jgi:serine/threonine-protein kinase RsbW
MKTLQDAIMKLVEAADYEPKQQFGIQLATEEAFTNAVKHGNKQDLEKDVKVRCEIDEMAFVIVIEDQGEGFDPDDLPDCTDDEHLELPNGRGVMLMKEMMHDVEYNDLGNCVTMRLQKSA